MIWVLTSFSDIVGFGAANLADDGNIEAVATQHGEVMRTRIVTGLQEAMGVHVMGIVEAKLHSSLIHFGDKTLLIAGQGVSDGDGGVVARLK